MARPPPTADGLGLRQPPTRSEWAGEVILNHEGIALSSYR